MTATVAVVGAGPAGCAAAIALARAGIDTVVFEQCGPFRPKACGDAFVPRAVDLLEQLGLSSDALAAAGGNPVARFEFRTEQARLWASPWPEGESWVVRRAQIDEKLRMRVPAPARILYRTRILDMAPSSGRGVDVSVRTERGAARQHFEAVVLAAGGGHRLGRTFGVDGRPNLAISVAAHSARRRENVLQFEFGAGHRPGYAWTFPAEAGHVNAGVCSLSAAGNAGIKRRFQTFLRRQEVTTGSTLGGVCALWSGRGERWHHPSGVVSCGDAAGLVDPVSGEGLTAALSSGWRAGRAVCEFVEGVFDTEHLQAYSRWVSSSLRHSYRVDPARRAFAVLAGLSP